MDRASIYDTVTAKIIRDLESGILPWTKPWKSGVGKAGFSFPANATTGNTYSGINVLLLWLHGSEQGFPTQRWLTFPQAVEAGGHVRRGEKGTQIVRAGTYTPKGEKVRAAEEGRDASVVPFLKAYTVFNVAQCDGLDAAITGIEAPDIDPDRDLPRVEAADRTIAATGVRFINHPDKAFYRPADDVIAIPLMAAYTDPINWYRTAFHELGHSTGAKHRLNREFDRFGTEKYAREELVAEIAAAYLCAAHNIVPTVRHADYIGNWLEVLRGDSKAIFQAASLATKASDWILDRAAKPEALAA
ncbi:ArdC family protein [Aureimonas ureilytica]|uniref:ArdC family protein n=1 Tax=Aureimonas ureilytica TaxID=401562 RepID=UPI00036442E9|nr:zincin-like metallopeptidase domain-containing protein [Aureimonas ureilytica]